jgi:hypothetical protein
MPSADNGSGDGYEDFLAAFGEHLVGAEDHLFTTDAEGLYDAFLAALPSERRQVYACVACRRFVERYGALVAVTIDGTLRPWIWHEPTTPDFFRGALRAVARLVGGARVTGVFYSSDAVWGLPQNSSRKTGQIWRHMAFTPGPSLVFKAQVLTNASQAAAAKRQEHQMLLRGLAEFPLEIAIQAMTLLKSGNLYRSEKAESIARWFVELHERCKGARPEARENLVWLAVAGAPAGFAHIRAGMLGTLLEDVQAELPFDDIQRKWATKMDPLQYMRPQAAPTAGNIAQAEKVVTALQSAGALERRFARLEDLQTLWQRTEPAAPSSPRGGVFGHLTPKGPTSPSPTRVEQPPVKMTFEKFRREVLPEAGAIEVLLAERANFVAMVTTVNPDAPPILQWDVASQRNRVNWYVYPGGSATEQWGLTPGWVAATAITLMPQMWDASKDHGQHGKGVFILLDGCRDSNDGGIALFPEVLKAEYRPIRATIEAFSRNAKLQGRDEATACGVDLRAGNEWTQQVRVTDGRGVQTRYLLDRWD